MSKIFENNALRYYENGYNVLPIEVGRKEILLKGWQQFCETHQMEWQLRGWINQYSEHNIGIALGSASQLIALDFDDDIDGLHTKVQELLQGSLVKKKGRKGFTAFYRYNGEITKRWRKNGVTVVELLSTGTQTVVPPSIHPDTKQPYFWLTEDTLLDFKPSELTTLPPDFIEKVDRIFGYEEKILDFNNSYSGELPDLSEIEKALSFIPSTDYSTWIAVGMALQHNYGDVAFSHWDGWSCKAPNYDSKGMQYKWGSFGKYKGNLVGIGTIFHYAIGYGYIPIFEHQFTLPENFRLTHKGVDLVTGERIKEEIAVEFPIHNKDDMEFPKHLLDNAPGLPGEIAAWINSTSLFRQPTLALGAAICAAGTLFAHRIRNDSNLRTNFMVLGLAESGAGKGHAAECIKALFLHANLKHLTIGKAASDTGIINKLFQNNSVGISLMDEIGRELESLNKGSSSHESRIMTLLMEIYSQAGTFYDGKCYANVENSKDLIQPHLNLYGTSVPSRFFNNVTSAESIDGFLARWMIFQSHDIDPKMQEKGSLDNLPTNLLESINYVNKMPIGVIPSAFNVSTPIPAPQVIPYSESAVDILRQFSEACNQNRLAEIKKGGLLAPIWARSREHAIKLALVAHPYREGTICSLTMQWACELAMYLSIVAIKAINDNVSDSDHEKLLNKVRDIISRWCIRNPDGYMPHIKLCNAVRFIKPRERTEILTQLQESGMIEVERKENANKTISYGYKTV